MNQMAISIDTQEPTENIGTAVLGKIEKDDTIKPNCLPAVWHHKSSHDKVLSAFSVVTVVYIQSQFILFFFPFSLSFFQLC